MDKKQLKDNKDNAKTKKPAGPKQPVKAGKKQKQKWTRRYQPLFLLVIALISATVAVFALRANNLRMVELRAAVYAADESSGDGLEEALRNLREHVYGHMNTNLSSGPNAVYPPIQLKYTYERLARIQLEQEKAAQTQASAASAEVYNAAQEHCERTIPNGVSGKFRLDCIQKYVKEHPVNTQAAVAPTSKVIPKNLYQFDFVSPRWSPDLAGWSIVVAVISLLAAVLLWLSRLIRRR